LILRNIKTAFTNQKVLVSNDKDKMVRALKMVKKVFDEHDIPFWLDSGTLLGAVRDGKIIEWDDDIDISMNLFDGHKLIDASHDFDGSEFELGIVSVHIPTYGLGHFEIRDRETKQHLICIFSCYKAFSYRSGIYWWVKTRFFPPMSNIMKFFFYNNNDTLLRLCWKMLYKFHLYKDAKVRFPMHYICLSTDIDFYGEKFNIPIEYKNALAFQFGEDWRTPKKGVGEFKNRFLREV